MEEIDVARNKLEMSWKEIGDCFIRGIQAAFIDDPIEKQQLIDIITKRVNIWVKKQEQNDEYQLSLRKSRGEKFKKMVFGVSTIISSYILYRITTK